MFPFISTPFPPTRNRTGITRTPDSQKFWSICTAWSTSTGCVPTAGSTRLSTRQSGTQMRTCGALKPAMYARARSRFLMRQPSYLPLACLSCLASRIYRESRHSKARCFIRPAGGMTSTSAENVSAFWATAALRKLLFLNDALLGYVVTLMMSGVNTGRSLSRSYRRIQLSRL